MLYGTPVRFKLGGRPVLIALLSQSINKPQIQTLSFVTFQFKRMLERSGWVHIEIVKLQLLQRLRQGFVAATRITCVTMA